jgi:hypothetical protein
MLSLRGAPGSGPRLARGVRRSPTNNVIKKTCLAEPSAATALARVPNMGAKSHNCDRLRKLPREAGFLCCALAVQRSWNITGQ